jgi:2-polyprenyl-3-methyl-5-hydroxy-6-metoxy-1,4-benzoquinol methylase
VSRRVPRRPLDACHRGEIMDKFGPATYGERIADSYDELYPSSSNTDAMVETLAKLAGSGPALELGIGTGRVALPLASKGLSVHGIDASEAMIKRLQAKPNGASISVTVGDFANVDVRTVSTITATNLDVG